MASDLAVKNKLSNSFSDLTIFIPFPPPPPAAFIRIGKPISLANFLPLSKSEIPPSEPSITGRPYFFAIFFASILSPIILISFEDGPINFILFSSSILAKLKFSDKNPYPG